MADRPQAVASQRTAALVRMLIKQIDGGAAPEAVRPILMRLGEVLAADAEKARAAAARAADTGAASTRMAWASVSQYSLY